jgi:hypothetical protein
MDSPQPLTRSAEQFTLLSINLNSASCVSYSQTHHECDEVRSERWEPQPCGGRGNESITVEIVSSPTPHPNYYHVLLPDGQLVFALKSDVTVNPVCTSAITASEVIRFPCPGCNRVMKAPRDVAGRTGKCPSCSTRIQIPNTSVSPASALAVAESDIPTTAAPPPAVPFSVTFPKVGGGIQTQVSQETADTLAAVAVGAAAVLGGIALWVLCPPAAAALTAVAAAASGQDNA